MLKMYDHEQRDHSIAYDDQSGARLVKHKGGFYRLLVPDDTGIPDATIIRARADRTAYRKAQEALTKILLAREYEQEKHKPIPLNGLFKKKGTKQ